MAPKNTYIGPSFMERVAALRGNQRDVFQTGMAGVMSRTQEANQSQARAGLKNGDWGQGAAQAGRWGAEKLRSGRAKKAAAKVAEDYGAGWESTSDEIKEAAFNREMEREPSGFGEKFLRGTEKFLSSGTGDALLRGAGDALGGAARAFDQTNAAMAASAQAGAMADARNDQARKAIIAGAEDAADRMNLEARQMSANLTNNAIGQKNAFESGQQAIGMSGIAGSDNMTRNLQYGQNRADAGEQLAYDIAGQQADALQGSMAQSFDSLSQSKVASMQNAFNGSLQGAGNALTADRADVSQYAYDTQPGINDYYAALGAAEKAAPPLELTIEQQQKELEKALRKNGGLGLV